MTRAESIKAARPFQIQHVWIAIAILLTFGIANLVLTSSWRGFTGTILGPFVGAHARMWQPCCSAFSWNLFLWVGPLLLVTVGLQFLGTSRMSLTNWRTWLWVLGWTAWCLSGWASFLHALE